ncbi:MAG: ferredoxin [Thermodesulfobacteriota bacterium]
MPCRITIDTYRCNSCETCVVIAPESFRMNEALDKAEPLADTLPCDENQERAAAMCPEKCIVIETLP